MTDAETGASRDDAERFLVWACSDRAMMKAGCVLIQIVKVHLDVYKANGISKERSSVRANGVACSCVAASTVIYLPGL